MQHSTTPQLILGHLYPDQLNLYGDRGNILVLRQRCQRRGIQLRVVELGIGDALAPDEYDMLFIGGGQDKEQAPVLLSTHRSAYLFSQSLHIAGQSLYVYLLPTLSWASP